MEQKTSYKPTFLKNFVIQNPILSVVLAIAVGYLIYYLLRRFVISNEQKLSIEDKIKQFNQPIEVPINLVQPNSPTLRVDPADMAALAAALDYPSEAFRWFSGGGLIAVAQKFKKSEYNAVERAFNSWAAAVLASDSLPNPSLEDAFNEIRSAWIYQDPKEIMLRNMKEG